MLSELSFTVDPPVVAPPSADERMVALLRRSYARGVTTFDLAVARSPARAERLVAKAFPDESPAVAVIVGRSLESLAEEGSKSPAEALESGLAAALTESLSRSRARLGPVPIAIVEWSEGRESGPAAPVEEVLPKVREGAGPEVAIALRVPAAPPTVPVASPRGSLFSSDFSLLEPGPARWFNEGSAPADAGLLARNAFASGRLDGSRFSSASGFGIPGAGPVDVRRMHEEFDPVLSLEFLTKHRRRTLAQAALQFVLAWPWVVTAIVPLPAPERWEELLAYTARPSLTEEDLARVGLVK